MIGLKVANPAHLGVLPFEVYDLIVDVRTREEFEIDHIPGAMNAPRFRESDYQDLSCAFAQDEHLGQTVADEIGRRNMRANIESIRETLPKDARVLVYGEGGSAEAVSERFADELARYDVKVDVLPGGYADYRAWVVDCLQAASSALDLRVIFGPRWTGKTDLLRAIGSTGAQTIDLSRLLESTNDVFGRPRRSLFESYLMDRMRRIRAADPVWIEMSDRETLTDMTPFTLRARMVEPDEVCFVTAPLHERAKRAQARYQALASRPDALAASLCVDDESLSRRAAYGLAKVATTQGAEAFVRSLLKEHADVRFSERARSVRAHNVRTMKLPSLSAEFIGHAARSLISAPA